MRRLWEQGCSLVQIGIRSLTRSEHAVAMTGPRIATYYAHHLAEQWSEVLEVLRRVEGKVYLTIDIDSLDPSIIPSTGTPLRTGCRGGRRSTWCASWRQKVRSELVGEDVMEFVPSAVLPAATPRPPSWSPKCWHGGG